MTDIIIIAVVAVIVAVAAAYVIRAKKKGCKCIGCPHSASCENKNCTCNK